jgi:RHS repeat-associated protein
MACTLSDSALATFEYDGAGRRTEKVATGLTHQYIYDAEDIVEEQISGTSTDTIRYYRGVGIDEPLARKNAADVVMYYLSDHLGSIIQETSASGAIILEREYGPWGDLLGGASTAGYAFQGREWDSEIALYYFRARYYNAAAGAWASDDPIAFAGGPNFTQFVSNNPLRFVDPFGLCGGEQDEQPRQPTTKEVAQTCFRILAEGLTPDERAKLDQKLGNRQVSEAGMPDYRAMLAKVAETAYKNLSPAQVQALKEAMEGAGKRIMEGKIKDLARPENLWAKMQHVTRNADGTPSAVVHYWMNLQTKIGEFFKFK